MTSKERVKKVLERNIPDKVPIFEQLIVSNVASKILGRYAYTGGGEFARDMIEAQLCGERDKIVENYIKDVMELHEKLDMDIISVDLVSSKCTDGQDIPKRIAEDTYRAQDPYKWHDIFS